MVKEHQMLLLKDYKSNREFSQQNIFSKLERKSKQINNRNQVVLVVKDPKNKHSNLEQIV